MANFTEDQRGIFPYLLPDGAKRFADPLRIRRRLLEASDGKIDEISGRCSEGSPVLLAAQADGQIAQCIRSAFGLTEINEETGDGASEEFCIALFNSFREWYDQKKMTGATPPAT